ncbi:MAG: 5,10-methylenetetrahydrofolate reductase, partial [uncultured Solirubrobacteraceae bacterium]
AHRSAARPQRAARLLVRVLPPQDGRGRAQPRARAAGAQAARPRLRLRHLRGRRIHAREDDRPRLADQGGLRPGGDGPPDVRQRHHGRAAAHAGPDARRGRGQRPGPPRRPAARPGALDEDGRRPGVLPRARRAPARGLRLRDRRCGVPRDAHPRLLAGGRPAVPQGEGRRGRAVPHHADVLRQPLLLRLRRPRAGGGDRRADRAGRHADPEPRRHQAHDRAVGRAPARGPARAARGPARERRGGRRARRGVRHAPVRRSSARRRAGHPLHHPESLPRHTCDPQRPPAHAALAL